MTVDKLEPIQRGYYKTEELKKKGVFPPKKILRKSRVAVIECLEEIPCNPCGPICPADAIKKPSLSTPPSVDWKKCTGCTLCIHVCPGLAIFCQHITDDKGYVTLAYELSPAPKIGNSVFLFNRAGKTIGEGKIVKPTYQAKDRTFPRWIITVEVPSPELSYEVREIKIAE